MEDQEMNAAQLGRLEKVDLRTVWTNESADFTPWLAEEDNLARLGDTIGVELELEDTEKSVGPFKADILCKDTVNDQWVLIENQLERTDHGHLGQLLTYAAGLNAVTVVWIAERFTEEHRAALDWLNDITTEDTDFFGLEIELWRIGNSPAAPKFNMASKPNDWSRKVSRAAGQDSELSELKQLYLEYWTRFSEVLEEKSQRVSPRKPRPQHWMNLAVGRSGCRLTARVSSRNEIIAVELGLNDRKNAVPFFELLEQNRQQIEAEVGEALNWRRKPNKKECAVEIEWQNEDPTDRNRWPEQHKILVDMLDRFHAAFSPRLKQLDPAEYEEAFDEDQHEETSPLPES